MLQDLRTFIKIHKKAMIWNAILVCVCYLHMIFSPNVGVDTEVMISNESRLLDSWEAIGRQGLVASKMLLKLSRYNPYFGGIVFLGAFIWLGILTAFLCWSASGRDNKYPYGLFMALFSTCPVWMMQFYFSMQRAEVILGLIYAVLSVFSLCQILFYKKQMWYLIPVYLVFGVWSFCSYQGSIAFYIGLCIMFFLMDFARTYRKVQWKESLAIILKLICGFLLVFLINLAITQIFFGQGEYLMGQMGWGRRTMPEIAYGICGHIFVVLTCFGLENRSAYPFACICIAVLFIAFCRKKEIKKSLKFIFFLALAGLISAPFLLTFYMGSHPVPRSQFALQLISAFGCMFACGMWREEEKAVYVWMRKGIVAVSVLVLWFSVSTVMRFQYTDDVRYQEDVRVAGAIWEDIQKEEGAEGLPVIFVGQYVSQLNGVCMKADVYGPSFLGWDYNAENPTGATGRIIGFMKTLGINIEGTGNYREKAVLVSEYMDCYPHPGYISVQNKYVVVKLSEIE
ncbi:glucosyltransferase domain-containing protein [Lachnospiraceae bacterium 45-W7]